MKRITVSLPGELAAAVEREAHRRRVSVSHVIRERLKANWESGPERHIPFASVGRSGTTDTARRIDEVFVREWGSGRAARPRALYELLPD